MNRSLNIFVPHCSGCLTDTLPHGDGLVAHGFITRLAERGHNLYVVAERAELAKPLPSNVHLFLLGAGTSSRAASRISYVLRVRSLFRQLRKNIRFDLAHQLNPVYTGISLALWGFETPIILGPYVADWPHDPHAIGTSWPVIDSLLRKAKEVAALVQQRSASAILLTTEAARHRVSFADRWRAPIHYLPHGIDSDFFRPAKVATRHNHDETRAVILFYANISERKGVMDMLQAFELVAPEFSKAELWIAGDGDQLSAAKDFASSLHAQHAIHFLGRQTREQAVALMQRADLFCLASHGEPYGMTVVEAMSCGLPVIVTDGGGAGSLAGDEGGLHVPMKSPPAIALALSQLLADPPLRKQMGLRNRQRVLLRFAWDKVIDHLEQIYALTLERGRESQVMVQDPGLQMAEGVLSGGERR